MLVHIWLVFILCCQASWSAETKEKKDLCDREKEAILLLHSHNRMSQDQFQPVLHFVQAMIDRFQGTDNATLVAVLSYFRGLKKDIRFDANETLEDLKKAVKEMKSDDDKKTCNDTTLSDAINHANSFLSSNSLRKQIIIIVTSTTVTKEDADLKKATDVVHNRNETIVVVGVGGRELLQGLMLLVTTSITDFIYNVTDFDHLPTVVNLLSHDMCLVDLNTTSANVTAAREDLNTSVDIKSTREDINTTSVNMTATRQDLNTTSANVTAAREDLNTSVDIKSTREDLNTTSVNMTATRQDFNITFANVTVTRQDLNITSVNFTITLQDLNTTSVNRTATRQDLHTIFVNVTTEQQNLITIPVNITSTRENLNRTTLNMKATRQELNIISENVTDTQELNITSENVTDTEDRNTSYMSIVTIPEDLNTISPNVTTTEQDLNITSENVTTTEQDLNTTSPNVTTTEQDLNITSANVTTTEQDLNTTSTNVTTTEQDLNITSANVTTTEQDLNTTSPNVTTTEQDLNITSENVTTTEQDLNTTSPNVTTTEQDLNITSANVTTTEQDLNTTSTNVTTTEQDLNTTCTNVTTTEQDLNTTCTNVTTREQDLNTASANVMAKQQDLNIASPNVMAKQQDLNTTSASVTITRQDLNTSVNITATQEDLNTTSVNMTATRQVSMVQPDCRGKSIHPQILLAGPQAWRMSNLTEVIRFIEHVITAMDARLNVTQLYITAPARDEATLLLLNQSIATLQEVSEVLRKIEILNFKTSVSLSKMKDSVFTEPGSGAGEQNTIRIVIIINVGSFQPGDVKGIKEAAQRLKHDGIKIVAIGVNSRTSEDLENIASTPLNRTEPLHFEVDNYTALVNIEDTVVQRVCRGRWVEETKQLHVKNTPESEIPLLYAM